MTTSTVDQRTAALDLANRTRFAHSEVKRELAAGELTIPDALEDPRARSMQVEVLLRSARRWGPMRSRRLLRRHGISETARVGFLTDRQRQAITYGFLASGGRAR